jgi:hypothetical protein
MRFTYINTQVKLVTRKTVKKSDFISITGFEPRTK